MIWANRIMQTEIVPPGLAQPAIAVALLWMVLQIVKEVRQMLTGRDRGSTTAEEHRLSEHRLKELETAIRERITRTEYESRHADLRQQLQRIEQKLDNMWGARRVFLQDDSK